MKFDGIMIISDLDGTFFNSSGKIADKNIEAVEYFKKNGGLFTIATGRTQNSPTWLSEIFTPLTNAPAILCNGAYCYDFAAKKRSCMIELNYEIASEFAMRVHREFPEISVRLSFESVEHPLTREEKISEKGGKYFISGASGDLPISAWTRVSFDGDADSTDRVRAKYDAEYSRYFALMKPCPVIYEFQDIRATKGQALGRLRGLLGSNSQSKLRIYAAGDYENDLDLLTHADVAACPENAIDTVQNISSVHLCHCDAGAIADLISKIEAKEA